MKHVRSFSDVQLKDEFDKIRHAAANLLSQHLRRSLKRQGVYLEQPDSKKSKSTEPQKTSVPAASRPSSAGVTPDDEVPPKSKNDMPPRDNIWEALRRKAHDLENSGKQMALRTDKVECREDFHLVDNTLPTDNVSTHNVADVEHIVDSHVRNVGNCVNEDACNEGGSEFVFGSNHESKGILNKPTLRLSPVQSGPNLFHKHKSSTAWSSGKVYGIDGITKTNSRVFYFKFKNEEAMKSVLESSPWMVNNVSLVLNIWEPGISLEKVEASTILIWFCVYNIPMELCNGNGIGKIMSRIGKPMLMDKMTKERCLKKSGKLDFARVLVEVLVDDELPSSLEIAYPPVGNRPARVGKLDVRPRYEEEIAAQTIKEAINVKGRGVNVNGGNIDNDDGFVIEVGKINRLLLNPILCKLEMVIYLEVEQKRNFSQSRSNVAGVGNMKAVQGKLKKDSTSLAGNNKQCLNKDKDSLHELNIWPELQKVIDDIMEAVIYPSKATRMERSLRHMDYFYGNYHKFNLDPSFKYDDVESETNVIAKEMKSDYMVDDVLKVEIEGTFVNNLCGLLETRVKKKKLSGIYRRVFGHWDWVFNAHSCDGGTRIIVGWDPRSVNVMVIEQASQRRSLWRSLMKYKCSVGGTSWVVLGDFNVSIDPSKKSSVCSKITTDMCDFKEFYGLFPNSYANFLSFMKFDHSSIVLVIPEVEVEGYSMFSVVSKLKSLKRPLRKLNADQGNPFDNVKNLRAKLGNIQSDMVADPYNNDLREAELKCLKAYNSALKYE
ncbi:reverse transcriptase domain-containing protein [Tanacetum coccineum]